MYVYYHFTSHLLSWASHIIIPSPSERKINCFWFGWIWIEQKWWNRSEATRNAGDRGWKRTRKEWRSSILASLLLLSRPPPLLSPLRYTFITPLLLSLSLSLWFFTFLSVRTGKAGEAAKSITWRLFCPGPKIKSNCQQAPSQLQGSQFSHHFAFT